MKVIIKHFLSLIRTNGIWLVLLALPIITLSVFGIYYEEYESLFTLLISGKLTPGTTYDNLYYMAHIGGLSHIYSALYTYFPLVNWINWINYIYLLISIGLIFYVIKSYKLPYSFYATLFLGVIFIEHFMLMNMTRTSFLLCFSSLLFLLSPVKSSTIKLITAYVLFTIGIFTRIESGVFTVVAVVILSPFLSSHLNIKRIIKLLSFPAIVAVLCVVWVEYDSFHSVDFYKQIEPDTEYELMVKNNFVPIENMHSTKDSIRYLAIKKGIWGDAKINDASFLKSLIGKKRKGMFTLYNHKYPKITLEEIFNSTPSYFIAYFFCVIVWLVSYWLNDRKNIGKLIISQLCFFILLLFINYQLKMVPRISAPMISISIVFLVIATLKVLPLNHKIINILMCILILLATCVHIKQISQISNNYKSEWKVQRQNFEEMQRMYHGKSIFLNGESLGYILVSHRPFEQIDLTVFKNVYIYNTLAITTIRPYKDYLEKECKCDVENYANFFTFIKKTADKNTIFIMSENHKEFMELYLNSIHNKDIKWEKYNTAYFEAAPYHFLVSGKEVLYPYVITQL